MRSNHLRLIKTSERLEDAGVDGALVALLRSAADDLSAAPLRRPRVVTAERGTDVPAPIDFGEQAEAPTKRDFDAALQRWFKAAQAELDKHFTKGTYKPTLSLDPGRRYVRVWSKTSGDQGRGSAYAFIDKTNGDVLKPASWKAPAKHARANIFEPEKGLGVGAYGANYLR